MSEIFIAGVSMTRFGPQPEETVKSLSVQSVHECLENAGAEASQIEAVYFSNATQNLLQAQVNISGQIALQGTGLDRLIKVNMENVCASGSTALWLAKNQLLSGQSDIVMVVGTEKMVLHDATLSERVCRALEYDNDIDICTLLCRTHMARFGMTQRQLAIISSKNHANSTINPKCLHNRPFSVEEILEARLLCYPLTVPMCAPPSDGSAATLLCTKTGLRKLNGSHITVRMDSCVQASGNPRDRDDFENYLACRAADGAYAQAGIGPEDVDVAEVQDVTSFEELLLTELLGFCAMGDGGQFAESGASSLNGRLPVNPSGGLTSKGHPICATGLGQIYELVMQLRGEAGPRQLEHALVAVQENDGGLPGDGEDAAVVTVLSR